TKLRYSPRFNQHYVSERAAYITDLFSRRKGFGRKKSLILKITFKRLNSNQGKFTSIAKSL
ncbi:hypothetical protein, partial [Vibrio rumoiensis]|uniref:hypothetical protein n=1 Tax=Vibrio rumoiensis TaxID=76258 RepID=UPI001A7E1168